MSAWAALSGVPPLVAYYPFFTFFLEQTVASRSCAAGTRRAGVGSVGKAGHSSISVGGACRLWVLRGSVLSVGEVGGGEGGGARLWCRRDRWVV